MTKINKILYSQRIIKKLIKEGFTKTRISKILECSTRTIYNWINYKNNSYKKLGRIKKLNKDVEDCIIKIINKKIIVTQNQIKNFIKKKFNIDVHQSTISRTLKRLNITYKKISKIYSEKRINNDEWINEFKEKINYKNENILAMDECSFHMNETYNYGYSLKGKRAYKKSPGNKGKRYSLILCISNKNKIINSEIYDKTINSEKITLFFNNMKNENGILLLDNASCHKSKVTKENIDKNCKFQTYHLPPYSPMLNPTEYCFSNIKNYVRRKEPRNLKELEKCIKIALLRLSKDNKISNIFNHCLKI